MIIYLVCFVFSFLIFLYSKNIGNKLNLIDVPDNLTKEHYGNIPLIGGMGIVIAPLIYYFFDIYDNGINREIISILLFYIILFVIGIVDDRISVKGYKKLLLVFISSYFFLSMSHHHFKIEEIYFYISSDYTIQLLDFWVIFLAIIFSGFIFALNISDGKNGVTLSFSIIALLILYFFYYNKEISLFITLNLLVMMLAFVFNLRNKMFLGTNGVNIICIALLIISINLYKIKLIHLDELFLIFYVHIYEIFRLFILRFLKNQNPFKRDINHLHHIIFNKFSTFKSLFLYNTISFFPFFLFFISKNILVGLLSTIIIYVVPLYVFKKQT